MFGRKKIFKWTFVVCIMLVLLVYASNADEVELQNSEYENENFTGNSSNSYFEELRKDSRYIAERGSFPETVDFEWEVIVNNCWLNLTKEVPYSKVDESIVSYACAGDFLIVEVNPNYEEQLNSSKIDTIYHKINDTCTQTEGVDKIPVIFMFSDANKVNLTETDFIAIESIKSRPDFIAIRGMRPEISDTNEKGEWSDSIYQARHTSELEEYFVSNGGVIVSYGYVDEGYIEVELDKEVSEKISNSTIDELYQIIDEHHKQEGVDDVLVVFVWGEVPIEDEGEENDSKAPGFSSISFLVVLFSLARNMADK
jgi:hypothetical protein